MKKKYLLSLGLILILSSLSAQELPSEAEPGKCYIKCITQDEFKDITNTIVVSPAYKKLVTHPATYKTVKEKVLVKEASKKMVYVPATYKTVEASYVSKEETTNLEPVPATFSDNTKSFEVYPKVGRWEYTQLKDCPSANKEDCMSACFVEYPARNQSVLIKTLIEDAKTRNVEIPGKNATYTKKVINTPAKVKTIEIPAEYATIKRLVIDQPARVDEKIVPEITKIITKTVLTKKGGMTVWEEIDCNLVSSKGNILPIFYKVGSSNLTSESKKVIDDNLLNLMRDKPNIRIEIASHTDSRGNDNYNQSLSQQRAQAVVNHLVTKGIKRNRLVAKGYGETRLRNRCGNDVPCSAKEHQANRRTEFRILQ